MLRRHAAGNKPPKVMKRTALFLILFFNFQFSVFNLQAQTADTVSQATLDSIDAKMKLLQLNAISVTAPKPVYSMTGEVVNYNVENDETMEGLTAWDAIRNAPTVQVDAEGNLTMRGSDKVEVWLNGQRLGVSGEVLRAFFESLPADAVARIEVIKNPSAKYMVENGTHIVNIVTSSRLRTSELWIVGLSGNTRPYLSPWASYVRNSDRLRFNVHLSGSHSHGDDFMHGDAAMLSPAGDTTSRYTYQSEAYRARYFGNLMLNLSYKIDSTTDFSLMNWTMLQGDYDNRTLRSREQWDYLPDTAHYRYRDSSDSRFTTLNGFTNFDIKRRFSREGHNLTFGGTWNYMFSTNHMLRQRIIDLALGLPSALLLDGYDRTSDSRPRRNSLTLSLTYNRPLADADELTLRVGGTPYGNTHSERSLFYRDPVTLRYTLPDTLRNATADYDRRSVFGIVGWRHEWKHTTLSLDLRGTMNWLHILTDGLFPDDTTFRFLDLEPSLGLTYRTESMHYFRLNLSHSVSNPSGSDLTLSRQYDDDSYTVGNRSLRPSYTEKFSLSWNRYYETFGNVSLDAYANYTTRGIESVTASTPGVDPWLGRIVSYSMPYNIASSFKYGLDASGTYRPAAWLNLSLRGSIYHQGYQVEGEELQERLSWNLYARLWTKVAKLVNLEVSANYGTPTLGLYYEQQYALTVDLGASATFFDGRLGVRLSVSDLFDANRYQSWDSAPTYAAYTTRHYSSRYLTFGLSWRFGKLDLEWQAHGGAAGQ